MRDFESSLQRISSKLLSAEATSLVKAIEQRKPIPHCDTRERLSRK